MDRRSFIKGAAWFTVASAGASLAACGGSSAAHQTGDAVAGAIPGAAAGDPAFPSGVASGDPRDSSLVFWTRCLPAAGGSGSGAGSPDLQQALRLDVALDPGFATLAATVALATQAAWDWTVRAKVTGLAPGTRYWYRFVAGAAASPIGQAQTAPAATAMPAQLRFGWISCQDWSVNHWAAMTLLAQEELDFVVHLGDYVYETVGADFQALAAEPAHPRITLPDGSPLPGGGIYANTLEDYRTLYRTYRSDPRLQALHAKCPMLAIWDDHEFSDDCWQDHQTYTNADLQQTARRRAANQAWAEYMPVDWGEVAFDPARPVYDDIRIYRDFHFGTLLHLVLTDERLYRDDHVVNEASYAQASGHDPVNGNDLVGTRYLVQQSVLQEYQAAATAALGRPPGILGPSQAQWWKDTLQASTAAWKVWGNEVTLNRMQLDLRHLAPSPYDHTYVLDADSWDGYPAHRAELLGFLGLQGIRNVVAISGDLHAFQCGTLYDNADPSSGHAVAVDFVGAGISSTSFYQYLASKAGGSPLAALLPSPGFFDDLLRLNNPALAYADGDAQGYAVATVTPAAFGVVFSKVAKLNADGSAPAAPLGKRTRITLASGSTTPLVEDNIG